MSLQVAKLIKNRHTIKNKSRNSNTLTLKSQLFAPITSISPRNFTSFSSKILMAQIDNLRYDDDLIFFVLRKQSYAIVLNQFFHIHYSAYFLRNGGKMRNFAQS